MTITTTFSLRSFSFSLVNLLVLVAACLSALLLAEGLLRLLPAGTSNDIPSPPPPQTLDPMQENPFIILRRPYIYFHIPHSRYVAKRSYYEVEYRINSNGFRGPEFPLKSAGRKRLLFVGDSMVEGAGVDFTQTSAYLLNQYFEPYGWEVLNAGVQGASPIYFAANLQRYLALQPDAILLMLYSNDLAEDRMREHVYFDLPLLTQPEQLARPAATGAFRQDSKLLGLLSNAIDAYLGDPLETIVNYNRSWPWENDEQRELYQLSRYVVAPSLLDQYWQGSSRYLDYFVERIHAQNIELFIADLVWEMLDPVYPDAMARFAVGMDERVTAWAQNRKLPFISLLPLMRDALERHTLTELVIEDDRHPTVLGQQLIATALFSWLQPQLSGQTR